MPSACTKPDNKASAEAANQIATCIQVVEKKVRNLEKRKGKLDGYIDKQKSGSELNHDQKDAVSKYDGVLQNLEFARDLQKHFQTLSNDLEKLFKKKAKREKIERQEYEMSRMRELLKLQELLGNMGSEEVREDFKSGSRGAVVLEAKDLEHLDELYKIITPLREGEESYENQLSHASEHIVNFIDGRDKEAIEKTTYKELKEMVDKIHGCGYFDNINKQEAETVPEPAEPVEEPSPIPEPRTPEPTELEQPSPEVVEPEPVQVPEPVPVSEPVLQTMPSPVSSAPVHMPLQQIPQQVEPVQQLPVEPMVTYVTEDDSFFSTSLARQPRAFQEIVSSVQGSFNFLQESELDIDYAALQQAGYPMSAEDQTAAAATYSQHVVAQSNQDVVNVSHHAAAQPIVQHVTSDSLDFGAASTPSMADSVPQIQFGAVDAMGLDTQSSSMTGTSAQQQVAALEDYDQTYSQNLMSQSLGGSTSSQHVASYDQSTSNLLSSNMGSLQDQSGSAGTSSVPPPIPMPDEVMPGQSLMSQSYGATDSENSAQQEKKAYTMNPNADPFQSTTIFSQNSPMGQPPASLPQTSSSSQGMMPQEERKPAWQTPSTQPQQTHTSGDYNKDFPADSGFGSSQFNRNSGVQRGRGASRGGSGAGGGGGRGSMNNGFPRGGNRGGASYNGNRNGFNNSRGGSRGGGTSWQGYPPRNDYRPEGGYQGYNNSYNTGGMRGGAPRGGGGMRGGRGGSGGFSRNQPYSQQA